jgi:hypothetical protein
MPGEALPDNRPPRYANTLLALLPSREAGRSRPATPSTGSNELPTPAAAHWSRARGWPTRRAPSQLQLPQDPSRSLTGQSSAAQGTESYYAHSTGRSVRILYHPIRLCHTFASASPCCLGRQTVLPDPFDRVLPRPAGSRDSQPTDKSRIAILWRLWMGLSSEPKAVIVRRETRRTERPNCREVHGQSCRSGCGL